MRAQDQVGEAAGDGRGLAAIAAATMAASSGISVAAVAAPQLALAFDATVAGAQWVMLAYLLAMTAAMVPGGRLGDLIGHRRVLLVGFALFTAASAVSVVAPTLEALIALRAAQGAGAALMMTAPMAIVRSTVPAGRVGAAMGMLGSMSAVGTALGPAAGGLLIGAAGWPAPFAALTLMGSVGLTLAWSSLPRDAAPGAVSAAALDAPGAAVLSAALLGVALAFAGGTGTLGVGRSWLVGGAALGFAMFVLVERRAAAPIVPPAALRDRALRAAMAMNLLVCVGMMATLVVGPLYLGLGLGLDSASVGLIMAAGPAIAALSGAPAGRLTDRIGAARAVRFGLGVLTAGFLALATLPGALGWWGYLAALAVLTPGFQLFLAANNTAAMDGAGPKHRGFVAGMIGLTRNLGFIVGASAMGALFAFAAGGDELASLPAAHLGFGFAATFVAAAALTVAALLVGCVARRDHASA